MARREWKGKKEEVKGGVEKNNSKLGVRRRQDRNGVTSETWVSAQGGRKEKKRKKKKKREEKKGGREGRGTKRATSGEKQGRRKEKEKEEWEE